MAEAKSLKVLLTGSTGFIGTQLLPRLSRNHRVFALTRSDPAPDLEARVEWIVGALAEPGLQQRLPPQIDAVVHLAQSRYHREFPERLWDIFDVNIRGLQTALEYARVAGASRFIFTSSANVYRRERVAIDESGVVEPDSYYGRSKRIGELLVESYAGYFSCLVARLFTVYGPGQRESLIPTLAKHVLAGTPVMVAGEAGLALSPIFVGDVADILAASLAGAIRRDIELVNIAGDEATGVLDLTKRLGRILGREPRIQLQPGDDSGWVGDNRRMHSRFDVPTLRTLDEGLAFTFGSA